jgi:exopolysaccharide production protein ExoQ
MGVSSGSDAAMQATQLEGSLPDRIVFQILVVAGIIVIIRRSKRVRAVLGENWPILIYFFYCLVSALWSDFPDVSAKRWIKAIGDLVMALVVATDPRPLAALKRLFSRAGFMLLPPSLLLIKYFPDLGRVYDPWFGNMSAIGVTYNKNVLGVVTLVFSLAAVWLFLPHPRPGNVRGRGRHLLAQGVLLAFGVTLLKTANSATSLACFIVGTGLLLATNLPVIRRWPAGVHVLVLTLLLTAGSVMLLGGEGAAVGALGRNTTLTGRTDIWKLVIPMAPNALVGAGFESFWLGPRLQQMWAALPNLHVNEAHDGYIEVYLNLGWVGLCLIALVLINGYLRCVAAFRLDPGLGSLLLAYVMVTPIYNITEAGFRMLHPMWTFLLLAIVVTGGVTSGVICEPSPRRRAPAARVPRFQAGGRVTAKALVRKILIH